MLQGAVEDDEPVDLAGGATHQQLHQTRVGVGPRVLRHRPAVLVEPQHVGAVVPRGIVVRLPGHEFAPDARKRPGGREHGALLLREGPVQPRLFVVLAVGVVVALLRLADLVAGGDHRDAQRQHQGGHGVRGGLQPCGRDGAVAGRPLHPVVVAAVVVVAVAVLFAVVLVVLAVVAREVPQGEAVVCRDEVDGRQRSATGRGEQFARSGEHAGQAGHGSALVPGLQRGPVGEPEVTDRVPVAVVPVCEAAREAAGLPAPHGHVPRFGDQLDAGHRLVGAECDEKRVLRREVVVPVAAQGHGEIEPESVHVVLLHPQAQRVHGHPHHVRLVEVHRVAAAGGVEVVAVGVVPVVLPVRQTPPGQCALVLATLGRVVEHDVEDHLDASGVQQLDHALELVLHRLRPRGPGRGGRVLAVRGEEAQGVVAPVVGQAQLL